MDLALFAHRLTRRSPVAEIARETLRVVASGRLAALPVSIRFWDGSLLEAARPPGDGAAPVLVATSPRALAHLLYEPGELGLSRAYVDGSLTVEGELADVLGNRGAMLTVALTRSDRARLLLAAVEAAGPNVLRRPPVPAIEARVGGTRHSFGRDRQAVRHHYDVSNDFYELVLGETMVYSCAYFREPDDRLEEAQERKLDLICRKLDLHEGEELLDIGCGWGSLVIHAAAHYGVRATGFAAVRAPGPTRSPRTWPAKADCRIASRSGSPTTASSTDRHFGTDRQQSAPEPAPVGRAELDTYVQTAFELLRPGGLMLNHGITRMGGVPDSDRSFIARYIFPDGELHPVGDLIAALQTRAMEVRDVESLREHYPLTLRSWLANLRARRDEAVALVGPERVRSWDLYMLGCALAFESGKISVYQVLAAREGAAHGLPLDRAVLLAPRDAVVA